MLQPVLAPPPQHPPVPLNCRLSSHVSCCLCGLCWAHLGVPAALCRTARLSRRHSPDEEHATWQGCGSHLPPLTWHLSGVLG